MTSSTARTGLALAIAVVASAPIGCGSSTDTTLPPGSGGGPGGSGSGATGGSPPKPTVETLHPDVDPLPGETECVVVITTGILVPGATHVPTCTPVDYATNPPSGGDHWGFWAAWQEFVEPIPREVYVHNLEHGGVVLSHDCAGACPEVVTILQEAMADATPDPKCMGFNARIVITPDPELETPVAASAWGATYTATCLDPKSLGEFVEERYAKGTEDTCAQGKPIDMIAGCDGGAGGMGGSGGAGGGG